MSDSRSRELRDKLNQALRKERLGEALRQYEALQMLERNEPRWPHRKGDLLKRLGRPEEAVEAYERAVDLYAQQGFVARAAAMAKVVLGIAPGRVDVLERVNLDAARKLHRSTRSVVVTADAGAQLDDEPATHTKNLALDALPLVADDSAGEDLLRFTKPPAAKHLTLDLDISDAEVQDRPPTVNGLSERPTAEHLAQLPSMPLFAEVPKSMLAKIVQESRLIDLEPGDPRGHSGRGEALYLEGRIDDAIAACREAIRLDPEDGLAHSALGAALLKKGDCEAAINADSGGSLP